MKTTQVKVIISMKTLEKVANDAVKCAETINLIYVKDSQPGIDRKKSKNSFRYFFNGKKIEDEEILMRIKKLVLPPAWENVWICKKENGDAETRFKNSKVYSQIGVGVLIKNENLVFNTFQISVSFYPLIPGIGQDIFKMNSFRTSDFGFRDFEIGKPAKVIYR